MSTPTDVAVESSGGTTLAAYRWDPAGPVRGVVQLTHGMGEHARRYAALADALTAQGLVVYAQDHRGHGATARSAEELGRLGPDGWGQLVADIDRLRLLARTDHPDVPLVLLGHSMGSFAVQQYLLDYSDDVDAVVLSGTALLDLLEPALDLDEPIDLSGFNAPFAPARTDYDWLSRDEAQVDAYVADPLCGFGLDEEGGRAMFVAARPLAAHERLTAIRSSLPVYVAVGDADPVGGGLTLVTPLVDRLHEAGLEDVTLKVYPGARHEIFNETNRDEVHADLVDWLSVHLPADPA